MFVLVVWHMQLKTGDRVESILITDLKGISGTIRVIDGNLILVEFDEWRSYFHNGGGQCRDKRGHWFYEFEVKLANYKVEVLL
jgi:hypothetical protein